MLLWFMAIVLRFGGLPPVVLTEPELKRLGDGMPTLHVVVASTRPGRKGLQVGEWVVQQAHLHGHFDVRLVDLADVGLPLLDEPAAAIEGPYTHVHTQRWSELVSSADCFIFCVPEYNNGFSATIKNALDYLYFEWNDKAVGLVSYGNMSMGLRGATMLKPVLAALKMVPTGEAVAIPLRQTVGPDGMIVFSDSLNATIQQVLDELKLLTPALISIRSSRKSGD